MTELERKWEIFLNDHNPDYDREGKSWANAEVEFMACEDGREFNKASPPGCPELFESGLRYYCKFRRVSDGKIFKTCAWENYKWGKKKNDLKANLGCKYPAFIAKYYQEEFIVFKGQFLYDAFKEYDWGQYLYEGILRIDGIRHLHANN